MRPKFYYVDPLADPMWAPGTHAPGSKFFHFHIFMEFSAKSLQNNHTLRVGALLRKILDPPLNIIRFV